MRILRAYFMVVCCLVLSCRAFSQLVEEYERFRQQVTVEYSSYKDKANAEYADFLRKAWKSFGEGVIIHRPKDEMLPPVIYEDDESLKKKNPLEGDDHPVMIDEVIKVPVPGPQPLPLEPIRENPVVVDNYTTATLYGTAHKARFPEQEFTVGKPKPDRLADTWERLAKNDFNNTIRDCLENRIRYNLSDWAYLHMLTALCEKQYGKDTPEAEIVKAYIYSQSGYQMRLALVDDALTMLYASDYVIYGKPGWLIDGMRYYCDKDNSTRVFICEASFPGERPMSTAIALQPRFHRRNSDRREINNGDICASSYVNVNYIDFCNDYPDSQYGDDPMTRWAILANTPTSPEITENLYPQLEKCIAGVTNYQAVDQLCHWVQTAFVYEYDDKVWGQDRAFFADETLYYPYCDCEDRSILLTRIVRDMLCLECALVYYPGHLATAIAMGEDAKGDFIRIDGKKFLICDPTFINAPIGMTMPGMSNAAAKVIVLK